MNLIEKQQKLGQIIVKYKSLTEFEPEDDYLISCECSNCGHQEDEEFETCEECGCKEPLNTTAHEECECEICGKNIDMWEDVYISYVSDTGIIDKVLICENCYQELFEK